MSGTVRTNNQDYSLEYSSREQDQKVDQKQEQDQFSSQDQDQDQISNQRQDQDQISSREQISSQDQMLIKDFLEIEKSSLLSAKKRWISLFGQPDSRNFEGLVFALDRNRNNFIGDNRYWPVIAKFYQVSKFTISDDLEYEYFHFGYTWLDKYSAVANRYSEVYTELQNLHDKRRKLDEISKEETIYV